jgi:hypothetical protein
MKRPMTALGSHGIQDNFLTIYSTSEEAEQASLVTKNDAV